MNFVKYHVSLSRLVSKSNVACSCYSKCNFGGRKLYSSISENGTKNIQNQHHIPVLADEVAFYLDPKPGQTILDMTFGAGGHTRKLLETVPGLQIFGLDRDPVAYSFAEKMASEFPGRFTPLLGRFSEVQSLLKEHNITEVDGILFDLGCSSMQFDDPSRGFGLSQDGPLDMRMDGNRFPDSPTASQILQFIDEEDLAKIIKTYGEEVLAKKIARAIIESRYMFYKLDTTHELATLVAAVIEKDNKLDKLGRHAHSATKTFQALRIFVNNELNELNRGLELAYKLLKTNGIVVALTFHSLEDRIVKRHLVGINMDEPVTKTLSQKYLNSLNIPNFCEVDEVYDKRWSVVTKHVLNPTFYEVKMNPRARSAKLRCASKN
ncbi:unnamed protein product [Allacma fusca]|uniref:Methyltransferase-like protein 15 homolog n=1 Tax=Allacma fusca TaxID=39272 RepID=A0A8J2PI28_9HEXA|nr:unnamed protein product [Allacma fusca]